LNLWEEFLSHSFRYKEKRSRTQTRKLILTMAMYGDHGYQLEYHLSNEESVK
jgi:hypothetical protein